MSDRANVSESSFASLVSGAESSAHKLVNEAQSYAQKGIAEVKEHPATALGAALLAGAAIYATRGKAIEKFPELGLDGKRLFPTEALDSLGSEGVGAASARTGEKLTGAVAKDSLSAAGKVKEGPLSFSDIFKAEQEHMGKIGNAGKALPPIDSGLKSDVPNVLTASADVRIVAAMRQDLSVGEAVKLAHDPNPFVRSEALANHTLPVSELVAASKDPDEMMRWSVARNRSTPSDTLREMSTDPDYSVRRFVEKNQSTPEDVRTMLKNEK